MHVLTLVANSTLLSYIKRIFGTVLQAGTVGMVLTRQRRGMYLHFSHYLKLQNGVSVLNVSAGLKITLCGLNLNYGKTKQHAI